MELLIDKDIINNIELLIEVYYFLNDGYSDLNVQIIEYEDSLRFDATPKSVNFYDTNDYVSHNIFSFNEFFNYHLNYEGYKLLSN